jgi:hypothetical protein
MERIWYRCPDGHIAKVMVYPVDDPVACPRLPEHSTCDNCGKVLLECDPQTWEPLDPQPPRPHERIYSPRAL